MLRNYSERLHGREATRPDVTYTFGGTVVETTVEMPVLENDPTKPRENGFQLKPGLTTEEEIKAYILDIVNNHAEEYNTIVRSTQDGTYHQELTDDHIDRIEQILSGNYTYATYDFERQFVANGWGVAYYGDTGYISIYAQSA